MISASTGVPAWNTYFPSLRDANADQRRFFSQWEVALEQGVLLDIQGNLSYLFVYLYRVIDDFLKSRDISAFESRVDRVAVGYARYPKVVSYIDFWKAEAYMLLGRYEDCWTFRRRGKVNPYDIVWLHKNGFEVKLQGNDLLRMLGSETGLSTFGKKHLDQIALLVQPSLDEHHRKHGANAVVTFYRLMEGGTISKEGLAYLRTCYLSESSFASDRAHYLAERKRFPWKHSRAYFAGAMCEHAPIIEYESLPYVLTGGLFDYLRRFLRECENQVRESRAIPRIGEGWVGESELFHLVSRAFPNERVLKHARPEWLAPLHLDIYLPERRIAIEYQGDQHNRPVEFFGGEKSFKSQQDRDLRKRRLCEENKCRLLYVHPGDDLGVVVDKIKTMLRRRQQRS